MTQPKRVLVVDDEQRNRNLMQAMLQSFGYVWEDAAAPTPALKRTFEKLQMVRSSAAGVS